VGGHSSMGLRRIAMAWLKIEGQTQVEKNYIGNNFKWLYEF
jgi:hypothetical protein